MRSDYTHAAVEAAQWPPQMFYAQAGCRKHPQKLCGGMRAAASPRKSACGLCGRGAGSRNPPRLQPYCCCDMVGAEIRGYLMAIAAEAIDGNV